MLLSWSLTATLKNKVGNFKNRTSRACVSWNAYCVSVGMSNFVPTRRVFVPGYHWRFSPNFGGPCLWKVVYYATHLQMKQEAISPLCDVQELGLLFPWWDSPVGTTEAEGVCRQMLQSHSSSHTLMAKKGWGWPRNKVRSGVSVLLSEMTKSFAVFALEKGRD